MIDGIIKFRYPLPSKKLQNEDGDRNYRLKFTKYRRNDKNDGNDGNDKNEVDRWTMWT